MTKEHCFKYRKETIEVWQGKNGRWNCVVVAPQPSDFAGIGPAEDYATPEAATDAGMAFVDDHN